MRNAQLSSHIYTRLSNNAIIMGTNEAFISGIKWFIEKFLEWVRMFTELDE